LQGWHTTIAQSNNSPLVRELMPNCNPVLLKRSVLAVAIVSLSACSTAPRVEDYDLSRIGEGILSAGRTTADVSQRAWHKTTYLLGFSDVNPSSDQDLLMDEVDLALMEEDAILPDQQATPRPVIIQSATAITQKQTPVTLEAAAIPLEDAIEVEDLVHEVASNETLWEISKKTTGDANNWHVLADVNNLAPNASVFPGQQLIIPADMVKPGYDDAQTAAQIQSTEIRIDTQNLNAARQNDEKPLAIDNTEVASTEKLIIPTQSADPVEVAVAKTPEGRAFKLNAGETLWDFSKRTTGDATNWQAIAGQNNFSEKQAVVVRAGQTIYVPEALVKPVQDVAANAIKAPAIDSAETTSVAVAETTPASDSEAISASTELLAEASTLDETQPIKIVEATFKADETITPIVIPEAIPSESALLDSDSSPTQVMVSGTYYPKAVYNEADFSSSLLMRVSPGTTLQVSKAMGNWFEVETDKGVGYVHQRDIK